MLTAIDLCCGAGGWAVAARGLPIRWLAVADIAPDCLEVWRLNHESEHPDCARLAVDLSTAEGIDAVRQAALERLDGAGLDLIVGGIPCEQVSPLRGATPLKPGALDEWHALIDRALGLVRYFAPRWWSIEDVIQIERHLPTAIDLGWHVPYQRIEAADFGPQRRLRTFLGRFPTPRPAPGPRTLGECLLPGPHRAVLHPERYEQTTRGRVGNDKIRALDPAEPSPTVCSQLTRGCRQRRNWAVREGGRVRLLSIAELARVQGFPADYLFAPQHSRMEQMVGRAIPIPVGRAILEAICREASDPLLLPPAAERPHHFDAASVAGPF